MLYVVCCKSCDGTSTCTYRAYPSYIAGGNYNVEIEFKRHSRLYVSAKE